MNVKLAASQPFEMKVLKRNPDGSGVVEIPILTTGAIDLGLTASSGEGTWEVTTEILAEMAANFDAYPGPVPVGFEGHVPFSERARESEAFVDALFVRESALVAHVFVTASRMAQLTSGMWRGFSFEGAQDAELPSRKMNGWFVYGGTFTNRPAADVVFRLPDAIAAETAFRVDRYSEGIQMADEKQDKKDETVSLSFHQAELGNVKAELTAAQGKVSALEAKVSALSKDTQALQTKLTEAESARTDAEDRRMTAEVKANRAESDVKALRDAKRHLEQTVRETGEKLESERKANLAAEVKQIVTDAIDAGVPPAVFDGYESDPAAWLESKYQNIEAFREVAATLSGAAPKMGTGKAHKSGHDPKDEATPDDVKLTEAEKARFAQLAAAQGHKVEFGNVRNEAEARKIWEAAKKAKE